MTYFYLARRLFLFTFESWKDLALGCVTVWRKALQFSVYRISSQQSTAHNRPKIQYRLQSTDWKPKKYFKFWPPVELDEDPPGRDRSVGTVVCSLYKYNTQMTNQTSTTTTQNRVLQKTKTIQTTQTTFVEHGFDGNFVIEVKFNPRLGLIVGRIHPWWINGLINKGCWQW